MHGQVSVLGNMILFTLAGKDFETDGPKVTFQLGQSRSSVCIVIIDDDIREGTEVPFGPVNLIQ